MKDDLNFLRESVSFFGLPEDQIHLFIPFWEFIKLLSRADSHYTWNINIFIQYNLKILIFCY